MIGLMRKVDIERSELLRTRFINKEVLRKATVSGKIIR